MKYYSIRAHDTTDCGAACIATVCKQYGLQVSIAKIREYSGTDRQGTNVYGVVKALEEMGFTAKAVKGDKKSIFTDFPLPCIAHVIVQGNMMHYVVIHKITSKYILISDPAKGLVKLTHEEFFGPDTFDENTRNDFYKWSGILVITRPSNDFKKGNKSNSIMKQYMELIKPQKKIFLIILLASLIYNALGIGAAYYFQALVDYILPNTLMKTLSVISIGIILLNIFKVILEAFRTQLLIYLSQRLDISLLLGYYRHVIELPMNFFGTRKVGEIVSRFNDASKVRETISSGTLSIIMDTIMVIGGGTLLYYQSNEMFGVTMVMVVLYVIIVLCFNKIYDRVNREQMEDNAQLVSYLVESLNGIQTVKVNNAEHKVNVKTESKFVKSLRSVFNLSFVTNIQNSLKSFVQLIGEVVLLWVGGINVIKGNITIGQLITFNTLVIYFLDPVKNLIDLQPKIQTAKVAADRLNEIMELDVEKLEIENKKLKPASIYGDIEFKNVDFRYGKRKLVLKDVNLKIQKGSKVAFVGESGSGKTTLSKLLLHLYIPEKGSISIGGNNIDDIQIETLRDRISYISQETFLFSGSILENLTLGSESVTLDQVMEASRISRADEFINELPLRYETNLEENGANLSGGQRQRLAIARALLKKSDILILDEATSNLDSITEKYIQDTLESIGEDMTVIFIAHRLSTIKKCDNIFVMEKGELIESGTHEELVNLGGKYSQLVNQQALEREV